MLAALLVLTAVAGLALAFVDAEQGAVAAVQYTNPSLYIATWVRAQPERAVTLQRRAERGFPSTEIKGMLCPRGRGSLEIGWD